MREREPRRVQELPAQAVQPGRAVLRIAAHGMADRQQVDADLVRAPGLQPHAQQRRARQRAVDLEVRDRRLGGVGVRRHARAHAAIAADRRLDRPGSSRRATLDQREVLAAHRARRERRLQRAVDVLALGDDEQARGLAIEPVHDPGAPLVLAAGDPAGQRLGERALRDAHAPDARRRPRACRRRSGTRPRRRPRTAPRRRPGRSPARRAASSPRTSMRSPPRTRWPLRAAVPSTRTSPAAISRAACEREPSAGARNASRRSPAASGGTSSSHRHAP